MNIYIGNLSSEVTDEDLKQIFENFGQVVSAKVIKDMYGGQSRGFGFVEMPNSVEAQVAIGGLNGKDLKGKTIKVSEARPGPEGDRRGGRGGGRY